MERRKARRKQRGKVRARLDRAKKDNAELLIEALDKAASLESAHGLWADATEHSKRALDERVAKYGEGSGEASLGIVDLAAIHATFGDFEKAEKLFRQAVRVAEKACGPECEALFMAYTGMQTYYQLTGNAAEAERYAEKTGEALPSARPSSPKQ